MGWMTTAFKREKSVVEIQKSEAERAEEEKQRVIEEEVKAGIREPISKLRYGLVKLSGGKEVKEADETTAPSAKNDNKSPSIAATFGDGGASWRARALRRAREQAERDGKSLDEVVQERWGDSKKEREEFINQTRWRLSSVSAKTPPTPPLAAARSLIYLL